MITQKKSQYFGGLSVILTGDPGQLPAVCAPSLYSTHSNEIAKLVVLQQFYSKY